jgi:hypothetical protein
VQIKAIDEQKVLESNSMVVQYEYIKAYLSIYTDQPEYAIARAAATKYRDFPDLSWRKRFREIEKQLKEYDQGKLEKEALRQDERVFRRSPTRSWRTARSTWPWSCGKGSTSR